MRVYHGPLLEWTTEGLELPEVAASGGKEGRHFLQSGTLKTSVSYQNTTPAILPSLCAVVLFCKIVHLKLWFSLISNLHSRPRASFRVHQDRRQDGGYSAQTTVAREQSGYMAVLKSFFLFSRLFPLGAQPQGMMVPTLKPVFLLRSFSLQTFASVCFSVPSR